MGVEWDVKTYGELKVESELANSSFLPKKVTKIHFMCPQCFKRICSPIEDGGVMSDCFYCGHRLLLPTLEDVNQQQRRLREQANQRKADERQREVEGRAAGKIAGEVRKRQKYARYERVWASFVKRNGAIEAFLGLVILGFPLLSCGGCFYVFFYGSPGSIPTGTEDHHSPPHLASPSPQSEELGRSADIFAYSQAAENGDAQAQYDLGVMYRDGESVQQDYAEAVKWFRLAAEQEVPEAQYDLGVMYFDGRGVPQNYVEAVKLYRSAAEQGLVEAQGALGVSYADGEGVSQDYMEAVKWFRLAADQGGADAQGVLALMYLHGKGVQQDFVEAYARFTVALANGNTLPATVRNRDIAHSHLTPQQLSQGQKRARELLVDEKGRSAGSTHPLHDKISRVDVVGDARGWKLTLQVHLTERVSEKSIESYAEHVVGSEKAYKAYFIDYFLPGMDTSRGPWAFSHLRAGDDQVDVDILGATIEEYDALMTIARDGDPSVIAQWSGLDVSDCQLYRLRKLENKFYLQFVRPSFSYTKKYTPRTSANTFRLIETNLLADYLNGKPSTEYFELTSGYLVLTGIGDPVFRRYPYINRSGVLRGNYESPFSLRDFRLGKYSPFREWTLVDGVTTFRARLIKVYDNKVRLDCEVTGIRDFQFSTLSVHDVAFAKSTLGQEEVELLRRKVD